MVKSKEILLTVNLVATLTQCSNDKFGANKWQI
jgi:hypothetical protein